MPGIVEVVPFTGATGTGLGIGGKKSKLYETAGGVASGSGDCWVV